VLGLRNFLFRGTGGFVLGTRLTVAAGDRRLLRILSALLRVRRCRDRGAQQQHRQCILVHSLSLISGGPP